jgi:hypothetical protein
MLKVDSHFFSVTAISMKQKWLSNFIETKMAIFLELCSLILYNYFSNYYFCSPDTADIFHVMSINALVVFPKGVAGGAMT